MVSWSSGKDSAMTLYRLFEENGLEVGGLLTTLTEGYRRVSMHGVREELVEAQAKSIGLPLVKAWIPPNCSNQTYEETMKEITLQLMIEGVEAIAFGDIFLEDVRRYRETNLGRFGMKCLFPLWGLDTPRLAKEFIRLGFRAVVAVVDLEKLSADFVGEEFDEKFLEELPEKVDPCGENGEFHTFVYDGPLFSHPVKFRKGGKVVREGRFCFVDLLSES